MSCFGSWRNCRVPLCLSRELNHNFINLLQTCHACHLCCSFCSAGQAPPVRATDQFEYEDLSKLWADVLQDNATHYQRAAAFRSLSALARASMTSDPNDTTLIGRVHRRVCFSAVC